MLAMPGVERIVGHQCQFGAEAENGQPVKKPTGVKTNCHCIAEALNMECAGRLGGSCQTTRWPARTVQRESRESGGALPDEAPPRYPERIPNSVEC